MAINKSKTSPWMKTFIIILIVAFVSAFMYSGLAGLFDLFKSQPGSQTAQNTTQQAGSVSAINAQYTTTVDTLKKAAESEPTSYTAWVNLGNTYFDWAQTLSTPAQGAQQATTEALTAAQPHWAEARDAYAKALQIKKSDPPVQVDFAVVTFYSGDATSAIAAAETVTKEQPDFAQAWLNLGVFYGAQGQTDKAIAAYEQYLKVDPNGQSAQYAKDQIASLKKSATTKP